jgi:hypothetical protein
MSEERGVKSFLLFTFYFLLFTFYLFSFFRCFKNEYEEHGYYQCVG